MGSIKGKNVLLTGASAGIGEALALELARRGANLVLLARRQERLDAVAERARSLGAQVVPVVADVRKAEDLSAAVGKAHETLGLLDVVIANAGFAVSGEVLDLSVEDFHRQFDTNVFGVLHTFYACVEDLKQTKGRFVIVGSVAGHISTPGSAAYSMSKFAARALAEALYVELARHSIGVTLISPGFVESELRFKDNEERVHTQAEDPAPRFLVMPQEKAARIIAKAVERGSREKIVTLHGRLVVFLVNHLRGPLLRLMRLLARTSRISQGPRARHRRAAEG